MTELAVLGAGPAGLMAALVAAEAGHRCTVFEAAPRVGGMAASFEVADQRVDFGSHRLHPSTDPALLARLAGLLGDDLQVRERNGRIRLERRWVGFPLRAFDLARHLPPRFALGVARDMIAGPWRRRRPAGNSFAEALDATLGPTIVDRFYGPYATKLYGTDPAELDVELARRRVSATSASQILWRVLRSTRPAGRTFLYPRGGYGQIAERLAEAATSAGADIRREAAVHRLAVGDDGVRVEAAGQGSPLDAAMAVSTLPVAALASVVEPSPPPAVAAAIDQTRVRAMVLVYLVVDRPRYTPYDAHYLPDPEVATARLSEPKNYRDGDDPPDRTVLCAEMPCWAGDDVWTASDADLGEVVTEDLLRSGLPDPAPMAVEVRRLRHVYPVFERRSAQARREVGEWGRSHDRLLVAGRQGLGVPDNLHHVLAMGADAAAAFTPRGVDRARWNRALDDFATHVVED